MTVTIVVRCDHEGCEREVAAVFEDWASVEPDHVTLDGTVSLDAAGWDMPGPPYPGIDQRQYCPEHVGGDDQEEKLGERRQT